MKKFSLLSVANPSALRPCVAELQGHRIGLPGVSSTEPLVRGCDQQQWLEHLVALGVRHLVVPLNGPDEDVCLYARRHPASGPSPGGAVYDLTRRDEGIFARLQFLLDAAEKAGVLIGLSLFDPGWPQQSGPLASLDNDSAALLGNAPRVEHAHRRHLRRSTTAIRRRASALEAALAHAVEWMAAELRGRTAVWLQVFRGGGNARKCGNPLSRLEDGLAMQVAAALMRPGEEAGKARLGPWLVAPDGFNWDAAPSAHRAPFSMWPGAPPGRVDSLPLAVARRRQALLCDFSTSKGDSGSSGRPPSRAELWRAVMHGCWPIVPSGFEGPSQQPPWRDLAQLAVLGRFWVGDGYLRPAPELLAPLEPGIAAAGKASAATDGRGRYFVYWSGPSYQGAELAALPGTYRYYWFEPVSGRGLDRGEGLEGGTHCRVPGPGKAREALLILEQEELPDPLSAW